MSTAIVIDKSFLQGSEKSRIHELATLHRLLVSDALFYELLTSKEPGRSRCFAKFPPTENPVDLVNHIGTLMRIEIDTHRPAGKPSAHREALRFQFNRKLLNEDYKLPEEAQQAVNEQTLSLRADVDSFVARADTIGSFFSDLFVGTQLQRDTARADAEFAIAESGSLTDFYATLESSLGENSCRHRD